LRGNTDIVKARFAAATAGEANGQLAIGDRDEAIRDELIGLCRHIVNGGDVFDLDLVRALMIGGVTHGNGDMILAIGERILPGDARALIKVDERIED